MGPDGPLTDPLQMWTARFYQWCRSVQSARHSSTLQQGLSSCLLPGVASGLCTAEPFVELHSPHPRWIDEWTISPMGLDPH